MWQFSLFQIIFHIFLLSLLDGRHHPHSSRKERVSLNWIRSFVLLFFFQITVKYSLVFRSAQNFTLRLFLWFWLSQQQASWEAHRRTDHGQTYRSLRPLKALSSMLYFAQDSVTASAAQFKSLSAARLLYELEFQALPVMSTAGERTQAVRQ